MIPRFEWTNPHDLGDALAQLGPARASPRRAAWS